MSDGVWTYTWQNGRELASMTNGTTTWAYSYDANGMRTKRTDGETEYNYVYNGGLLSSMTVDDHILYFTYDAAGAPMTVTLDGTTCYYLTNIQGDVIAILDASGNRVVAYLYDAWGNLLSVTGSLASTLGVLNPLRYRGYVYDTETELYYLQSRYYNPEIGRFINGDKVLDATIILGFNLFAYCGNGPVVYTDPTGCGRIYVIYYNNPGSGFYQQAMNSPYYNVQDNDVYMIGVTSAKDFIDAWNSIDGDVDYVFLYLHGDKGKLHFLGEWIGCSEEINFSTLSSKQVKNGVYLFSCSGGAGREGNNVAWMFAKLTQSKVYACTGSVSFLKVWGQYYARKALDWGIFKTFYYEKRFIFFGKTVAKSKAGQW